VMSSVMPLMLYRYAPVPIRCSAHGYATDVGTPASLDHQDFLVVRLALAYALRLVLTDQKLYQN
jgi:hypothetical protein